jgi:hypothetical protein
VKLCCKRFRNFAISKAPPDVPATIFISPAPWMWVYAMADVEVIHGVPLAPQTTVRHDNFDNMREIPFDEFVAWHPQSPGWPAY